MPSGYTTTQELLDSFPTVVASARIVREYEGVMQQLVDKVTLGEGTGLSWREVSLAAPTASDIGETDELNNPQQLSDSLFTVTPSVVAIHTVITDRVRARISKNALAKIGSLAQNAIERKKDDDGTTLFVGFADTFAGAGTTLSSGHLNAAASVVRFGAGVEPSNAPWYAVLHPYQIKDIADEFTSAMRDPANTTAAPLNEVTARVYSEGFRGSVSGVQVFEDANIALSGTDVSGGLFAKEAIVLVQGRSSRVVPLRNEKLGGGADELIIYDEYAYGERSSGNWTAEILSDATTPTS